MADIYLDRTDDNQFSVRVFAGLSKPKTSIFPDYEQANSFALSKLGKRSGMVLDTTKMTVEQLAAHRAREARVAELLKSLK